MKKFIAAIMALIGIISAASAAYAFPEPDWGALLSERRGMVTATDFDLYAAYIVREIKSTTRLLGGMRA